ncbi:hypothetical protein [Providencia sp. PROV046]
MALLWFNITRKWNTKKLSRHLKKFS